MKLISQSATWVMYTLLFLLTALSLTACNNKTSEQLPPGSTVQVSPKEIIWEIAQCKYDPNVYQDHTISIMVNNESGSYIPGAPLTVSLDLSANTFSGTPMLALYDDANGNGVIDGPNELVSASDSGIYESHTDRKTGAKYLILRVNLSCMYKGSLNAFSDGNMGTLSIVVKEEE